MTSTGTCPRCGTLRYQETSAGLCPKCLGALGFGSEPDAGEPGAIPAQDRLQRLGDYELIEEIARGGMGVVYRARQVSLDRTVALKVVLHGSFSSPEFVRRFCTEAAVVAGLRHPNIVAIHEVGQTEAEHFFSMDYIDGKNLGEAVREQPMAARRAAQCLKTIAEAVHYAHQRGVLHRDLKPSNVLLDAFDEPHITDFGLAKVLGTDTELTMTGQVLGSPSYIAPEQAAGRLEEVGPRSDIYSLGGILYQLLTGRPPFQGETLPEILLQVRDEEPVLPRRLNPSVPADLQTICLKCLQKEPARRYSTAQELADDLTRFLAHEPIRARPVFPLEKIWLWSKRRPALATLILALNLVLFLGVLGVLWQWRRAEENARGEREQRRVAEEFASWVQLNLYAGDISFASQALQRSDLGLARRTLARLKPKSGEKDLRGFEWYYLWHQCHGDQIATLGSHDWIVTCAAFSPDGKLLATGSEDATVKIWEVASRALVTTLTATTGAVLSVEFTPDNRQLVTAGEGGTYVWDRAAWKIMNSFNGQIASLARTSPLLAAAEVSYFDWWQRPGAVRIWNYQTGEKTFELPESRRVIALSPDGKTLACDGANQGVELWDIPSRQRQRTFATSNTVRSLVFSRDGNRLIAVVRGRSPVLFELNSTNAPRNVGGHSMEVWGVNFSPDGRQFATTSSDQTLRLWDATSLEPQQILRGHEHEVWCVAFSPDGKTLVSGSKDCQVMLWSVEPREKERSLPHRTVGQPFFSPSGDKIITLDSSGNNLGSAIRDFSDAAAVQAVPGPRAIGFSSDGKQFIRWGRYPHSFEFFSPDSTNVTEVVLADEVETDTALQYQGFSSDWKLFFTIDDLGRVTVWDTATGRVLSHLQGPSSRISAAAISRSGRWLALASRQEKTMLLFNCDTGKERKLTGHKDVVNGLDFSPDEQLLAGGSLDGTIRLWRPATGELEATLPGHIEETTAVAFAPDGRTLASVNVGLSVKLWHLATRRELVSWDIPRAGTFLRFSADGRHLAVTTLTNSVILFNAPVVQ